MKPRIVVLAGLCLLLASFSVKAQQQQQGNIFVISTYKIPFDRISEYFDFWERENKPRRDQNEFILSQRTLTHVYGPDWTVMFITEYKDLASIQAAQKRGTELFEKQYPDKAKRDELTKKLQSFNQAHTDAIVVENPKLRK